MPSGQIVLSIYNYKRADLCATILTKTEYEVRILRGTDRGIVAMWYMLLTGTAFLKRGAISSSLKPAIPHPIRVTRNFISGFLEAKLINVWSDGFNTSLHGRYGIGPTSEPYTYSPLGTEFLVSSFCCTAHVMTGEVAAEDENLTPFQGHLFSLRQYWGPLFCFYSCLLGFNILTSLSNPLSFLRFPRVIF